MIDTLSVTGAAAARKYGADYTRALTGHGSADRVTTAKQDLEAARKVLPPPCRLVMDKVAGRGETLADVARLAGIPVDAVEQAFLRSCARLADHYEARGA